MSLDAPSTYLPTHLTRSRNNSNSDGNAQFSIGAYYFTAEQNIDKVLFFNFESQKIEFYAGMSDSR